MKFAELASRYKAGYRNPLLGFHIGQNCYVRYNPGKNSFEFRRAESRFMSVPDPLPDDPHHSQQGSVPAIMQSIDPYMEVFSNDRIVVHDYKPENQYHWAGITSRALYSNEKCGRKWTYGDLEASGSTPIVFFNGTATAAPPDQKRELDNTARKEMNNHIINIRRQLRTRVKLNAFDRLEAKDIDDYCYDIYGTKWGAYNNGDAVHKMIENVDFYDFMTFLPFLWLGRPGWYGQPYTTNPTLNTTPKDLNAIIKGFDRLINRHRERLRELNGVVTYETPAVLLQEAEQLELPLKSGD